MSSGLSGSDADCDFSDDCRCLRCLRRAYADAHAGVGEAAARYAEIRGNYRARAVDITVARQVWTETRYTLVLADHNLRAAEDEAFVEARKNHRTDRLRWKPEEAL